MRNSLLLSLLIPIKACFYLLDIFDSLEMFSFEYGLEFRGQLLDHSAYAQPPSATIASLPLSLLLILSPILPLTLTSCPNSRLPYFFWK